MVLIRGGEFLMGSEEDEPGSLEDEKPQTLVRVKDFYVDRTEVTVGQFRRFIETTGYVTVAEREGERASAYGAPPNMIPRTKGMKLESPTPG